MTKRGEKDGDLSSWDKFYALKIRQWKVVVDRLIRESRRFVARPAVCSARTFSLPLPASSFFFWWIAKRSPFALSVLLFSLLRRGRDENNRARLTVSSREIPGNLSSIQTRRVINLNHVRDIRFPRTSCALTSPRVPSPR